MRDEMKVEYHVNPNRQIRKSKSRKNLLAKRNWPRIHWESKREKWNENAQSEPKKKRCDRAHIFRAHRRWSCICCFSAFSVQCSIRIIIFLTSFLDHFHFSFHISLTPKDVNGYRELVLSRTHRLQHFARLPQFTFVGLNSSWSFSRCADTSSTLLFFFAIHTQRVQSEKKHSSHKKQNKKSLKL